MRKKMINIYNIKISPFYIMSCKTEDIIFDCMDKRILAKFPGNEHLLKEGKLTDAKAVCMSALKKERSCKMGGKRRRRKSRRSRKSKRKSRRNKTRKSKKRKTRRRRRRRK